MNEIGKRVAFDNPTLGRMEGTIEAIDENDGAYYVKADDGGAVWLYPSQVTFVDYNGHSMLACDHCGVLVNSRLVIPIPAKNQDDGVTFWFACKSQDCIDALMVRE